MKKVVLSLIIFFIPFIVSARNDTIVVSLSKCVDGDTATFIYDDVKMNTRFLAVDTPETKHPTKGVEPFGKEASEYTCNALQSAKVIKLEFDENSDEIDKYSRYLVWVFVDDNLLQSELIEQGLAKVAYLYGEYKYTDILLEKEQKAKANKLGIWGDYEEEKDYTLYYVVAVIAGLIILSFIGSKNKQLKKINTNLSKELKKLIKKL